MKEKEYIFDCFDYRLTGIYQREYPELKQGIRILWSSNRVLPDNVDPGERANQAALACTDSTGAVVGVTTIYRDFYPRIDEQAFMYRMFIQPQDRNTYLMRAMTRITFEVIDDMTIENKPNSMIIVTENDKLMRPGVKRGLGRIGFNLLGRDADNRDVWQRIFTTR